MSLLRRRDLLQRSASALLSATLAQAGLPAHAQAGPGHTGIELTQLQAERGDDGLLLSYTVRFELPKDVEDALLKGVAVVFVAEADLFQSRWYWGDKHRAHAVRRWRLAYQPLTRRWRLSFDGLSRWYPTLPEALSVMRRASQWRIADNVRPADESDHYIDFSFRLDTDELPRPLQIGLGGQSDWTLAVQRRISIGTPR
ncbi:MAG: DUF4390 domain-containing protein [Burkholderiales bacterium]|nr:DUF4390 domain-containing protein [Burkholderiales bacterium]